MTSERRPIVPAMPDQAAQDQADEQERLTDGARDLLEGDPGEPLDRLSITDEERLMEQQPQRDFHA